MRLSTEQALGIAAAAGCVLWFVTGAISGRREAWDSGLYWIAAYPAGVAVAAALGYAAPERPWRWGLTLMLAQAVTMAVLAIDFSLLPLGLILFAVLAVPLIGAASATAALSRRRSR